MSRDEHDIAPSVVPTERPGPRGGKRDTNRRQRTRQIAEAALALFLERGIERVTIDDIARHAGIAKGSFYRYFEGKPDLVDALLRPLADRVEASMNTCEGALAEARTDREMFAAYQALAFALAPILIEQLDVVRLYLQELRAPGGGANDPVRALARDIDERAIRITHVARRHGLLRPAPPAVTALGVVGATEKLILAYLDGAPLGTPLEAATALVSMILDGLRVTED